MIHQRFAQTDGQTDRRTTCECKTTRSVAWHQLIPFLVLWQEWDV